jgi:hypothetical protein
MTTLDIAVLLLLALQIASLVAVAMVGARIARRSMRTAQELRRRADQHRQRIHRVAATASTIQVHGSAIVEHAAATRRHLEFEDIPGFLISPRLIARLFRWTRSASNRPSTTNSELPRAAKTLQRLGLLPPLATRLLPLAGRLGPVLRVARAVASSLRPEVGKESPAAPRNPAP